MLFKLQSTEIEYIKKFTESYENNEIIRFYDKKLPDMYTHNFTLIKNNVLENKYRGLILEELSNRRNQKADFLRIELNCTLKDEVIRDLPVAPRISRYDYMYIEPHKGDYLTTIEGCIIKKARSEEILKDGIKVDILANQSAIGTEFAQKRILRKSEIYQQLDSNLELYVCYYNRIPIGNCELMLNNEVAKIEDFDILEAYQRKGFGTSVVKQLLEVTKEQGIEFAYLITDSEDTAKDMYRKCGFKKAGEKTELFFALN